MSIVTSDCYGDVHNRDVIYLAIFSLKDVYHLRNASGRYFWETSTICTASTWSYARMITCLKTMRYLYKI